MSCYWSKNIIDIGDRLIWTFLNCITAKINCYFHQLIAWRSDAILPLRARSSLFWHLFGRYLDRCWLIVNRSTRKVQHLSHTKIYENVIYNTVAILSRPHFVKRSCFLLTLYTCCIHNKVSGAINRNYCVICVWSQFGCDYFAVEP